MKRFLKSSLSIILAITIIFSSAYVGLGEVGFSDIKFNGVNLSGVSQFLKAITPGFSVKSQAASSGTCGENLTWSFEEGTLTISGTGDMEGYYSSSYTPWYSWRSDIKNVVIADGVTSIGSSAFSNCVNLTSITIPDSVTRVSEFSFPSSIKDVYITDLAAWCNIDFHYGYYGGSNPLESADNLYVKGKLVTELVIPDSVTSICDQAFYNYRNLTSVIIPDSVTSIGDFAFDECSSLTSVSIGNSVTSIGRYAFSGCTSLTSVIIPDSVISVGREAFVGCTNLTSVTIGKSVTSIGDYAFVKCKNLTKIQWNARRVNDFTASSEVFRNDGTLGAGIELVFGDGVERIPAYLCHAEDSLYSTKITSVIIPDSVKSIGSCAFYNCTSLTQIQWNAKNITGLSDVFYNAGTSGVGIEIVFGDGVETIPSYMFYVSDYSFSPKITSVTISDSVTNIGYSAFDNCSDITDVYISDMAAWCSISFSGPYANPLCYARNLYLNDKLVTKIIIPDGVTSIGDYAFYSYEKLVSATIPDSTMSIGYCAFYYCTNLTSVTMPKSITSIGECAFYNCTSLVSVTVPKSVTSIGKSAFYNCRDLTQIQWNAKGITGLSDVFFNAGTSGVGIELVFGESVKHIPANLCYISNSSYIPKITSVIIPKSVTSIGNYAFYECTSLKYVFYEGNQEQWSTVNIGSGNSGLTNVVMHYESRGHTSYDWIIDENATCTTNGLKHKECTICGETFDVTTITPIHKSSEWITDEKATCVSNGLKHKECTSCGVILQIEAIYPTGHTEVKIVAVAPTCTETGKTEGSYCSVCGEVVKVQTGMAAKGHNSSGWLIDKKATVNVAGKKHKECTECGEVLKTATIPQLKCAKPVLKKVYNANDYVKITWGTVEGADLYRVYRMVSGGEYEYIGSTKNKYFNDKNLPAGKTCRYKIRAKNEAGYSEYSASIAIKHIDEPKLKTIANTTSGVKITWGKVTGAQKYYVYRKVSGGEYKYIGATTKNYYTDKTAKSGTKYYYAIRAKRDDSISSRSASLSKYYLEDPTLNTPTSTSKDVGLRWSKVAGAEGYMVYRRTTNGSYKIISTEKGVSNVTFRDTTAKKGTKYYYKVKAYYSRTYSAYSNTKAITGKY